ncbi:Prominin-1-A [Papilio machaon]|uniref:Prominin-1-A n=1 Tax=Papilio machaon TaxID=76193 RepID=A0A194R939_PAPMA|nr:Prominin-1-A [Papilio machaon]
MCLLLWGGCGGGLVSVSDGHVEVAPLREHWRPLLAHYAGPASALILAALFAAALPLAGLFWCCCQWCRVGRRRRPFDRKYDACIKGILAILLIGLLTLFLFGVVCAFATDSQVESGSAGAPAALRRGLRDTRVFLNATQAHARHLLVDNYSELERRLNAMLTYSGVLMSQQLSEESGSAAVGRLEALLRQLPAARTALRDVRERTHALREHAQRLNAGLRKVKALLLQTLNDCEQPKCRELKDKYKIGQLDTEIQYSQMPDVSAVLGELGALLDGNLTAEVARGLEAVRGLQRGLRAAVEERAPHLQSALADTGRRLRALAERVSALAGEAGERVAQHAAAADWLQAALDRHSGYWRHTGRAAAACLLLVTCLLAWGLVCGVCGKRPDMENLQQIYETVTMLRDRLRSNYSSLREGINFLVHETTQAEVFLNNQGPELVQNLTEKFASAVSEQLREYARRVQRAARRDVGRCGPVSHAYNATRDAACRALLMPVNGYWISLAWCVVLFVPLLLVSGRLARLYRHADPYPGPLVEAEYLYDAYADRDNVPLANGSKRSTLDIEGKIAECCNGCHLCRMRRIRRRRRTFAPLQRRTYHALYKMPLTFQRFKKTYI